jgi:hypothetical protein
MAKCYHVEEDDVQQVPRLEDPQCTPINPGAQVACDLCNRGGGCVFR